MIYIGIILYPHFTLPTHDYVLLTNKAYNYVFEMPTNM